MKHGKLLLMLSCLLASGCATTLPLASSEAIDPADAETAWRYIGIRPSQDDSCPEPPPFTGWDTSQLFLSTDNAQLRRFCLYSRDTPGSADPLLGLELDDLGPDYMAVTGFGSELETLSWQPLRDHLMTQVGQVALPAGAASAVRLAFVDASPNGEANGAGGPEDVLASSPHGTNLLNLARDLVCDSGEVDCRARVTSQLALAYTCYERDQPGDCRNETEGGFIGLIGELAQAVQREVDTFQSHPDDNRLVINLSVGWDPQFGGDEPVVTDMPVAVQAVFRALEDARCRGALAIAAAGNRGAGPEAQLGPVLPAYWERRQSPTSNECQQLGVTPAPGLNGPQNYRPLLFSAGGVKGTGQPLDNAREDGSPRLNAFADHAVVEFTDSGNPTGVLTGSSVAAAVVSATAAVAWSYAPNLNTNQLMNAVYSTSSPLGRDAAYCLGGSPCTVPRKQQRVVLLCQTVAEVCTRTGNCMAPSCSPRQPLDLSAVNLNGFGTDTVDLDLFDSQLEPTPAECGSETVNYFSGDGKPIDPCPHAQYYGNVTNPWTEPQPSSLPCPPCLGQFASPGTIYVEIDASWVGELTSSTLKCGDSTYALDLPTLEAGSQAVIENVPTDCLTSYPTFLSFTLNGNRAALVPVKLCDGC